MSDQSPRKRLAYLVDEFPSPTEQFIANEIKEMQRIGFTVAVLSLRSKYVEEQSFITYCRKVNSWKLWRGFVRQLMQQPVQVLKGIQIMLIANPKGGAIETLRAARSWFRAVDLMDQRSDFDHVHAHFMNTPTDVGISLATMLRLPVSFTAHARDLYVDGKNLSWKVAQSRFAVTCTGYNKRFMEQQLSPKLQKRVRTIYHGLDPEVWTYREPTSILDSYSILTVARLVEKKGIYTVMDALGKLNAQEGRVNYTIVGDGPERQGLIQKSKELQGPEVVFMGQLSHNQVDEVYAKADVLVHGAIIARDGDRDGIPNVLLEAMASGVPVVATEVSAIPELIKHRETGLLVPPNDPQALANALAELRADIDLRQRLARQARIHVEQYFHIRVASEQLQALFVQTDR